MKIEDWFKIALALFVLVFLILNPVVAILTIITISGCAYFAYQNVYVLARRQKFFTSVREGDSAIITSGPSKTEGKFYKLIMNYAKHELNNGIVVDTTGPVSLSWMERWLPGIFWLGVPNTKHVFMYKFKFMELDENNAVKVREELTQRIVVKKIQYAIPLVGFETASTVPVGLTLIITVRIIDPVKAVIDNDQWFDIVTNRIRDMVRQVITEMPDPEAVTTFLKKEGKVKGLDGSDVTISNMTDSTGAKIKTLGAFLYNSTEVYKIGGRSIKQSILDDQGVKLISFDTTTLDLGAWADTAQKLILAERLGEAQKKEKRLAGEAFKAEMKEREEAYKSFMETLGVDESEVVLYLEAIGRAQTSAGTTVIQLPSGLAELQSVLSANKKVK